MKKNLRLWITAVLGAATALLASSCADPYYSSVGATYGTGPDYGPGYGYGHGYGGSSFSTSIFVSTGNPRWGYDPYTYCYYDYHRRAYYDPYLYGYYPIGYRPPVVIGVPHPHGWRRGQSRIAPPSRIRDTRLSNYHNRADLYRGSNHSWARQVRPQTQTQTMPGRGRDSYQDRGRAPQPNWGADRGRTNQPQQWGGDRTSPGQRGARPEPAPGGFAPPADRPRGSSGRGSGLPSAYNTPIQREFEQRPDTRPGRTVEPLPSRPQFQPRENARPEFRSPRGDTRPAVQPEARPTRPESRPERSAPSGPRQGSRGGDRNPSPREESESPRGGQRMRGLGEG